MCANGSLQRAEVGTKIQYKKTGTFNWRFLGISGAESSMLGPLMNCQRTGASEYQNTFFCNLIFRDLVGGPTGSWKSEHICGFCTRRLRERPPPPSV